MAVEELSIRGLTGVDVALRIAGPGTRAYAFLIDWHFRVLLAAAWALAGLLVTVPGTPLYQWGFVVPAVVLYLFYHLVLETVMRGRTPGKRIAGARIVTRDGGMPDTGALLLRNVFRLIDLLPGVYLVGLMFCMWTRQRVRVGDLAAGTVLVLDEPKAAHTLSSLAASSRLDPDATALVREVLARWRELDQHQALTLARNILLKLDGQLTAAQLQSLDSVALRARLENLLAAA